MKPQVAASLRTLAVALQSYGKEKGWGAQRGEGMGKRTALGMRPRSSRSARTWSLRWFGYVWISLPQSCFPQVVPGFHEPSPCCDPRGLDLEGLFQEAGGGKAIGEAAP